MMVNMASRTRWLTTQEAAARLAIKPASLYAYVSRGVIGRHVGPDGRTSRFDAAEVEALARRGRPRRASRDPVVEVVVHSAITTVPTGPAQRRGHRYRGRPAPALADRATFESVAAWLVEGTDVALEIPAAAGTHGPVPDLRALRRAVDAVEPPATAASVLAALVATVSPPGPVPTLVLRDGTRWAGTVAGRLAAGLGERRRPPAWVVEATNATLVLLADHELATSTLAARVAASTRADDAACVAAALATLSGPLHGTASAAVRVALADGDPLGRLVPLAGDGPLPGFGHPLYAGADPRATALLERVRAGAPGHPALAAADRLVRLVQHDRGVPPNVDLGLATLTAAAGFPPEAGAVLFAVARTAGWLAHVAEERRARPLRYRARAVPVTG